MLIPDIKLMFVENVTRLAVLPDSNQKEMQESGSWRIKNLKNETDRNKLLKIKKKINVHKCLFSPFAR